jgi:hypothetical protein
MQTGLQNRFARAARHRHGVMRARSYRFPSPAGEAVARRT